MRDPVSTPQNRALQLTVQTSSPNGSIMGSGYTALRSALQHADERTDGHYSFVRHDDAVQVNVPLDADLELLRVTFAPSGAIDFLGYRIGSQEKVRGEIDPDAPLEATIVPTGSVDPAQVIAFTRIS